MGEIAQVAYQKDKVHDVRSNEIKVGRKSDVQKTVERELAQDGEPKKGNRRNKERRQDPDSHQREQEKQIQGGVRWDGRD